MPAALEDRRAGAPAADSARCARACAGWALLCVFLAATGQFLTVRYNYGGNASALFYTGAGQSVPAPLEGHVYRADDPIGFDGQFYHFIAHDPLLQKGFDQHVDNPRLRWRRILVPALAHIIGLGQLRLIDFAYLSTILGFLFLCVYWTARYLAEQGLHPSLSLALLLVPGVFISLERMTVDIALVALCAGFARFAGHGPSWKLYGVLALCPFARETGLLVAGAPLGHQLLQRRPYRAALFGAALLPYAIWVTYVHSHTAEDATPWLVHFPFEGLVLRTLTPLPFEVTGRWLTAAAVTDYLGILGTWVSLAAVVYLLRRNPRDTVVIACIGFVALAALLGKPDIWRQSYGFGRIFSPLYLLLAMEGVKLRKWWMIAPLALVSLRMAVQAWVHIPGIVRGLAG